MATENGSVVEEYMVRSALEMMDFLDPLSGVMTVGYRFRGHGNSDWLLEASLFREARKLGHQSIIWNYPLFNSQRRFELDLLLNFLNEADHRGFDIPGGGEKVIKMLRYQRDRAKFVDGRSTDVDLMPAMSLAQHSGVPTRLLDWSRSAFIALYFAARDNLKEENRPSHLCIWAIQADVVEPTTISASLPCRVDNEDAYLNCELKLQFLDVAGNGNPNLRAQRGDLLHVVLQLDRIVWASGGVSDAYGKEFSFLPSDLEALLILLSANVNRSRHSTALIPLKKILLPTSEAPKILEYLDAYGIGGSSIYPGLNGIADSAKERTHYQHIDRSAEGDALVARMERRGLLFAALKKDIRDQCQP